VTAPEFPFLDGVEHRFVQLPGLNMHVTEAGSGEPLLLLHGFPQHWWGWHKVLPAFASAIG
jgi:pimeloyl-ACP methyl ester carboxylesterase